MNAAQRPPAQTVTFVLMNAAFMAATAAVAAFALYPLYASSRLSMVAATAIAGGAVIAVLRNRLGWSFGVVLVATFAVFITIGLTLAIPGVASGETAIRAALGELLRGPVTGWKDLVTLPVPIGEYGATLVPVLAMLLVGTLVATAIAIGSRRAWGLAPLIAVAMVATAVLIGPATRALPLNIAPFGTYITREFVVGLMAFALLLAWLAWRPWYVRRRALAVSDRTARLATTPRARALSTGFAAGVMAVISALAALVLAGPIASSTPRDVARTVIDPRLTIDEAVTPLASYRSSFSDASYNQTLFSVRVLEGSPDRVRIATLPYFTGDEFTAAAPHNSVPAHFQRVPSAIPPPVAAQPVRAEITIAGQSGIWLPLVGELGEVSFRGERAGELLDSFFYQPATASGLVTAPGGVRAGDIYTVDGWMPATGGSLESLGSAPGGEVIDASLIPVSLSEWVTRQSVTHDGDGLAQLVAVLRERGYLSHALSTPAESAAWTNALGAYAFAPSAAGHSYDRIDRLFTELSDRESTAGTAPGASLVAAVGDDEQFAVAVALLAAELDFPSRVVLGTRLVQTDALEWAVPPCNEGVCQGRNLSVWAEVLGANGVWVPVDATPQHDIPPSPDVTQQQDPKFATALDPQRAEPVSPPASRRGGASVTETPVVEEPSLWEQFAPVVTATAISLLALAIIFGPFLGILLWKGARRRKRRSAPPRDAIHQGWDEYLDTALDAGLPALPLATRSEAARVYDSPHGPRLAQLTDAATFGSGAAVADDAREFWELVAAERARWLSERGFWARLRMRVSLKSLWYSVSAQAPEAVPQSTARVSDDPANRVR